MTRWQSSGVHTMIKRPQLKPQRLEDLMDRNKDWRARKESLEAFTQPINRPSLLTYTECNLHLPWNSLDLSLWKGDLKGKDPQGLIP
ncbi:hypothetical protein Tco_1522616 [Tanacetum coccineum]